MKVVWRDVCAHKKLNPGLIFVHLKGATTGLRFGLYGVVGPVPHSAMEACFVTLG